MIFVLDFISSKKNKLRAPLRCNNIIKNNDKEDEDNKISFIS